MKEKKKEKIMKIIVDQFSYKDGKNDYLHILTHAHTDHGAIPQKFPNQIYCSPMTAKILISTFPYLEMILIPILIPNKSISINKYNLFIFDSNHSFGSIGFIYKDLLYWGDGRPNQQMIHFLKSKIQKPLKSLKIDLFFKEMENPKHPIPFLIPTIDETIKMIEDLIQTNTNVWIKIPHFGALHVLPLNKNSKYIYHRIKPIPNQICLEAYRLLKNDNNGPKFKISLKMPTIENKYFIIYLSTLWWFFENCPKGRDLYKPFYINKNYVRVFLSTHASLKENEMLMNIQKKSEFKLKKEEKKQ